MEKWTLKVGDKVRIKTREELYASGWKNFDNSKGLKHNDSHYSISNSMLGLPSYKWYTINACCQGNSTTGYIFDEKDTRGYIFTSEMLIGEEERPLDRIIIEIRKEIHES